MLSVRLEKTFIVSGSENLDDDTDRVMVELSRIENADERISDTDMSATLSQRLVTIGVTACGDSVDNARNIADATIRSAIHATGGATPNWNLDKSNTSNEIRFEFREEHLEVA